MRIVRYRDSQDFLNYGWQDGEGRILELLGDLGDGFEPTDTLADVAALLAPAEARAIIGIGLNYRDHAAETKKPLPEQPMVFMKLPGSVVGPGQAIVLPRQLRSDKVDYEAELAVVIGKTARNVPKERALEYVWGYTCANDVSARDWQFQWGGGQFCRGKTFDTFCPLGPVLVTADELGQPGALGLRSRLNGEVMQDSNTSDLIFDIPMLIAFLSGSTTLEPGTVILTGTPAGVGNAKQPPRFLQPGDVIEIEIDGIGVLRNPVVAEV